jgi:hypothetical protein
MELMPPEWQPMSPQSENSWHLAVVVEQSKTMTTTPHPVSLQE